MPDPYFTYDDNGLIPGHITVDQNSAPPVNKTVNFNSWPATKFSSFDTQRLLDNAPVFPEIEIAQMQWTTRIYRDGANLTNAVGGYFDPRFSLYPDTRIDVDQGGDVREARFNYTTQAKADAATMARVMRSVGYSDAEIEAEPFVIAGGYTAGDFLEWSTFTAAPELYCALSSGSAANPTEFWVHTDTLVPMPAARLADLGTGHYIKMDFERQDGVSEADTVAFVQRLAALVQAKGQKLSIWPNTLSNDGAIYSGLTAVSMPSILAAVDDFSLLTFDQTPADTGLEDLSEQLDAMWAIATNGGAYTPPVGVLSITFSLGDPRVGSSNGNTSLEDARYVARWARNRGINRFKFWRNFGTQGSDDPNDEVNLKMGAIMFGANVPRPSARMVL